MQKILSYLIHSVLLQLLLGACLKQFLPQAHSLESWLEITSFSVVGLFMSVGLELHPEKFRKDINLSLLLVGATTLIPFVLFYALLRLFGLSLLEAAAGSVVLIATGTGVTLQTLSHLGIRKTRISEFIVLISALDDIPAAILMALLLSFAGPTKSALAGLLNGKFLIVSLCFWTVLLILRRRNLPLKSYILSLIYMGFGFFFSKFLEPFHVSLVMGGLLSGVLLSLTLGRLFEETQGKFEKILKPVLFIYMIYIGMKLSPESLNSSSALFMALALILTGIVSKWAITWLILRKRSDLYPALAAWGMVPRGMPGFAFASAAVSSGLIIRETFTILVLVVAVTTWLGLIGLEFEVRKNKLSYFKQIS